MLSLRRYAVMVVTALTLLCGMVAIPAQSANADSTQNCPASASIGKKVPVVLVHGLGSSGSVWGSNSADDSKMLQTLHKISGLYVDTPFDYSNENTKWVSNDQIGPRLARRIDCLATASKQAGGSGKVIVIGHSMGGLATRYAASQVVNGHKVSDEVGYLITIGTPNLGSSEANIATSFLESLCDPEASASQEAACYSVINSDLSALTGLQSFGSEIKALPAMPSNVPVLAIAGNATLHLHIIKTIASWTTNSDLVVGKSSALQGGRATSQFGGTTTVPCDSNVPLTHSFPTCMHTNLPHDPTVEQTVTATLTKYVASLQTTTFHFDGLNVTVPAAWKKGDVYRGVSEPGMSDVLGVRTGGACKTGTGVNSCPGFEIHGPNALSVDSTNVNKYSTGPWNRSTDVFPCASDPSMIISSLTTHYQTQTTTTVGGRKATYSEWKVPCSSINGSSKTSSFIERTWWLPTDNMLIVDDWNTPGLYDVMKNATWDSTGSYYASFVGNWVAHSTNLEIYDDGTGMLFTRNYASCPDNGSGTSMCNVTDTFKLAQQGGKIVAIVTSSKPIISDASVGQPVADTSTAPDPVGMTVPISLKSDSDMLTFGGLIGVKNIAAGSSICRIGSPDQDRCGA